MPNRIIKESIRTSKTVNQMTDFQFRIWISLITYVDDYGRGSADPEILRGFLMPRRKGITEQKIMDALQALADIGAVLLYEVNGDPYLCFPNWGNHQQIRNKKSKFPAPAGECNQLISDDCKCPRNPIQSNTNPNPNPIRSYSSEQSSSESEEESGSESAAGVIELQLNTGEFYSVSQEDLQEYASAYPAVDVMRELREMQIWCKDNPKKRKTAAGVRRFISNWLSKAQDEGAAGHSPAGSERTDDLDARVLAELKEKLKEQEGADDG